MRLFALPLISLLAALLRTFAAFCVRSVRGKSTSSPFSPDLTRTTDRAARGAPAALRAGKRSASGSRQHKPACRRHEPRLPRSGRVALAGKPKWTKTRLSRFRATHKSLIRHA